MRLCSSGCLRWSYLPQEVRRSILHTIADQKNPRWSALASVSKEWQSVIGTRNMAKLNLRPSCLKDLEQAVVRQRDLVRHIYLHVELPEYNCRLCAPDLSITIGDNNERRMAKAVLVLRMPNLTTMVLWNGETGRACAFMYTRVKHYAHITWRGAWDLEISRQVLEAWEDVAKLHSLELRITHERLQETIRSHGDAIFHLNLPCQVIEPTSLWQIRMEDAQGL
ncbi:hypothetical protein FCOIX_11078 [Fusarium coicis]|nr:hypothetical protein FCOIX_11078 [Fusarium coicis]